MGLLLNLRDRFAGDRLDLRACTPDRLERGDRDRLPVRRGRETLPLGDVFEIEEVAEADAPTLRLAGDCPRVDGVAAGWDRGSVAVDGSIGDDFAAGFAGDSATVGGSAGAGAARGLRGGAVRIAGDAGDHLAAAVPGARRGMTGGSVFVGGGCGEFAAARMRRGELVVCGHAAAGAAMDLIAGTCAFGSVDPAGFGLDMRRGTVVLGRPVELPSVRFAAAQPFESPFLVLLRRHLEQAGFVGPLAGSVVRSRGDRLHLGLGEVLQPAG